MLLCIRSGPCGVQICQHRRIEFGITQGTCNTAIGSAQQVPGRIRATGKAYRAFGFQLLDEVLVERIIAFHQHINRAAAGETCAPCLLIADAEERAAYLGFTAQHKFHLGDGIAIHTTAAHRTGNIAFIRNQHPRPCRAQR